MPLLPFPKKDTLQDAGYTGKIAVDPQEDATSDLGMLKIFNGAFGKGQAVGIMEE